MQDELTPIEKERLKRLLAFEPELEEIVQRERALTWFGKRAKTIAWWATGAAVTIMLLGNEFWERLRTFLRIPS